MTLRAIIGGNIRTYRTKLKWSQEKLAIRAKVSSDYLGRLERGEVNVSADVLGRIAKCLTVEPYVLLKKD